MINIDLDNLDIFLNKFFSGETTLDEERALEAFFSASAQLQPEYECYRDMFGWYASGMDETKLPLPGTQVSHTKSRRRKIAFWWSSSAAAAIIAAIVLGGNYSPAPRPHVSLYAETLVERDGIRIEGESEIRADIDAAIISGYCLEQEIDAQMDLIDIE